MATIQYTIRGIPAEVDTRLRRLARLKGQSLNQVVIDKLGYSTVRATKVTTHAKRVVNTDFDDLFGTMTPLEPEVEEAIKAQRIA